MSHDELIKILVEKFKQISPSDYDEGLLYDYAEVALSQIKRVEGGTVFLKEPYKS